MSGVSDVAECPRCGRMATVYMDWRPFDYISCQCPHCGFTYKTEYALLDRTELKEVKEEWGDELVSKPFTKKEKARIREFDEDHPLPTELPYVMAHDDLPADAMTTADIEGMSAEDLIKVLTKHSKWVMYTQVDSENDVAYLKGKHLVNRTGVYAFVPSNYPSG